MMTRELTRIYNVHNVHSIRVELTNVQLYRDVLQAAKILDVAFQEVYKLEGPAGPATQLLHHAEYYLTKQATQLLRGE